MVMVVVLLLMMLVLVLLVMTGMIVRHFTAQKGRTRYAAAAVHHHLVRARLGRLQRAWVGRQTVVNENLAQVVLGPVGVVVVGC